LIKKCDKCIELMDNERITEKLRDAPKYLLTNFKISVSKSKALT